MTETELDAELIRRALNLLSILCGDDGADDADRVTIKLARSGLDGLLNRIAAMDRAITDPHAGQARQAPDARHGIGPTPRPTPERPEEPALAQHPSSASCSD